LTFTVDESYSRTPQKSPKVCENHKETKSNSESKLCEAFSSNNLPLAEELVEKLKNDESNLEIKELKKLVQTLDTRKFYEISDECILAGHFNLLSFMLTSLEPEAISLNLSKHHSNYGLKMKFFPVLQRKTVLNPLKNFGS
jgi:hypothetical protein